MCELAAGACEEQSFEDFPDFESTPEPARCEVATITEVLNEGLGFSDVGQVVSLPWGEGPPEPLF